MQVIKNAIVYKAELPETATLAKHLAEFPFVEVGEAFVSSSGFVPMNGELVLPIEGGCMLMLRIDEKILPSGAVRKAIGDAIDEALEQKGSPLENDEVGAIEERVRTALIARALIKTTTVKALYHAESQFLVVDTTNRNHSAALISCLVRACGAVKTSTIHVDNVRGGLTARLRNYVGFDDDEPGVSATEAFDGFNIGDSCVLREKTCKVSFDLENLDSATAGLREALSSGMEVDRLELEHGAMSFRLTKDFCLRKLDFFGELSEDEQLAREDADGPAVYRMEAALELLQLVAAINALCDLFGYKAPAPEEREVTGDGSGTALPPIPDSAYCSDSVPLDACLDPMLVVAQELVVKERRASISFVQRKLAIGYNRAARLIEELEKRGVVSPMNPDGSREVLHV